MKHVSIREAKDRLTALIREVEAGEEIAITRHGQTVAELRAPRAKGGIDWEGLRRFKEERGLTRLVGPIPDDFDDPLSEDFLITPER